MPAVSPLINVAGVNRAAQGLLDDTAHKSSEHVRRHVPTLVAKLLRRYGEQNRVAMRRIRPCRRICRGIQVERGHGIGRGPGGHLGRGLLGHLDTVHFNSVLRRGVSGRMR